MQATSGVVQAEADGDCATRLVHRVRVGLHELLRVDGARQDLVEEAVDEVLRVLRRRAVRIGEVAAVGGIANLNVKSRSKRCSMSIRLGGSGTCSRA
jgi:hypothetical protein